MCTKNIKIELLLTLEEFFVGEVSKEVIYRRNRVCKTCAGYGAQIIKKCLSCQGQGINLQVHPSLTSSTGGVETVIVLCGKCSGLGRSDIDEYCKICRGCGIVSEESKLVVKIPQGKKPGDTIIFESVSSEQRRMKPGNVVVHLGVVSNPTFKVDGYDLIYEYKLLVRNIANLVHVPTIDKQIISTLVVPSSPSKICIGAYGLFIDPVSKTRGNLYLILI